MKIKNWTKYQHYKDRNPPWIKLHRKLLDDREFHQLEPVASKLLVYCWLLAAEDDGNIPNVEDLAFRLRMDSEVVKSSILKLNHWIQYDSSEVLASCEQVACVETETETETETERPLAENLNDTNFRELKDSQDVERITELCDLATNIYKNTQFSHEVKPWIINLLGSISADTLEKAIRNAAAAGDPEHKYRKDFKNMFITASVVDEISKRPKMTPQNGHSTHPRDKTRDQYEPDFTC